MSHPILYGKLCSSDLRTSDGCRGGFDRKILLAGARAVCHPGTSDLCRVDNRGCMQSYAGRVEVKEKTEELFDTISCDRFADIEKELIALGFIQRGSDPASAEFEHREVGLMLDVEFNEEGDVHAYELLTAEEMDEKQRRFRW